MNKIELDDVRAYLHGDEDERHRIVWKYMELYEKTIQLKGGDFRNNVTPEEVLSDAVLAIDSSFSEIAEILQQVQDSLDPKVMFNRHLKKILRANKKENQPLAEALRDGFKGSVRRECYAGYKETSCTVPESVLVTMHYQEDTEEAIRREYKEILGIIKEDQGTDLYRDLIDYYIGGRTMESISNQPRNNGISKQAISKRMKAYMAKISEKVKKGENNA